VTYIIKKAALDQRVAAMLDVPVEGVACITSAFLREARDELVELNTVVFDGMGVLTMSVRAGKTDNLHPTPTTSVTATSEKKYHVTFKKTAPFRQALRRRYRDVVVEKNMDKLGVDETGSENEKKASEGCPKCGSKVERHGNVLACPKCGTEPFEATKTT